uniref:Centromere protein H C-terminal domain-containing protein n=1 Tax=Neogobius melanostomus TaxID=47308 RepID=A0A8C6TDD9_9GOBI
MFMTNMCCDCWYIRISSAHIFFGKYSQGNLKQHAVIRSRERSVSVPYYYYLGYMVCIIIINIIFDHRLDFVSEMENVKTNYFNGTLALHRMQMWHALAEKIKQTDSESHELKGVNERCMALSSQIIQLQKESRTLQEDISELQKKRLAMKRLTHEKMKDMEELKSKKDHPDSEKYKSQLEKGQTILDKYKKMSVMTQNVLRGLLLACKINWIDDPKLYDIAMTLEELPISE